MLSLLRQVDALLAVLAAFPIAGAQAEQARELIALARGALGAAVALSTQLDDLAAKLAGVRADVEAIAAADRPVTPEEMIAVLARVREAGAAFEAAHRIAEARAASA